MAVKQNHITCVVNFRDLLQASLNRIFAIFNQELGKSKLAVRVQLLTLAQVRYQHF